MFQPLGDGPMIFRHPKTPKVPPPPTAADISRLKVSQGGAIMEQAQAERQAVRDRSAILRQLMPSIPNPFFDALSKGDWE